MRMQLCRMKFRKSCILLTFSWIKFFPEKIQSNRGKIWINDRSPQEPHPTSCTAKVGPPGPSPSSKGNQMA